MDSVNETRCYIVMTYLIGCAHTQTDPGDTIIFYKSGVIPEHNTNFPKDSLLRVDSQDHSNRGETHK